MTKYIKIRAEFVLPVPFSVRDSLDSAAEAGLSVLEELLEKHVTAIVPGSLQTSWQAMPAAYSPINIRKPSKPVLAEEIAPGFGHVVDSEDRVMFVEVKDAGVEHPWDQGLLIFPSGHPLHPVEQTYYRTYIETGDPSLQTTFDKQAKELEAGSDDDDV